ncbi:class I SAM-dependent methyltransferase [Nodularia spumigena CS-1038]|uniref:class I SAM-dependent methyltransferase n=1 Tax=Nodularia spumigena TaxID=70799 RepID=UPI00232C2BAF|nr:class I SAM-dependent methyltransferase [Nodularia spumigena]MDB9530359.1 class I SAM-dependent methyltransferase [Nodularia spumigena CS-1038]
MVRDAPDLEIRECDNCGLVYLSSTAHIDDEHYGNSGMFGSKPPNIEDLLKATSEDDQRRFEILKSSLVNKNLLDFGCGSAGFLIRAKDLAHSVAGVEIERRMSKHWEGKLLIHSELESAGGGYDLITAFHVIEHLKDPIKIIKDLLGMLKDNGRLVIEVPSSDDVLLTLYKCASFQKFTYWSQHLYLFNPRTLSELAKQAGARIIAIKQFQRYPLSNHLYWLSNAKPGGHEQWNFLDTDALHEAYSNVLASLGKCDTIIAYLERDV